MTQSGSRALVSRITLGALLALSASPPPRAQASPLLELLGAQADGGATARVSASGASACYFNPALLPHVAPGAAFGLALVIERIDVDLAERAGASECDDGACDVPEVNGAGPESFRHADGSSLDAPTVPTRWLEDGRRDADGDVLLAARPRGAAGSGDDEHGFVSLGANAAFAGGKGALGVHLLLPLAGAMQTHAFYADEREQLFSNSLHPELYGDRLRILGLAAGVGFAPLPWLSLGVSASLGIASAASAPVYVPSLADLDTVLLDSRVSVSTSLAPHFGVAISPTSWLRFAATAHSPQGTEIETRFGYVIATGVEQRAQQTFVHGYLPWMFALGAQSELGRVGPHVLSAAVTGSHALWSDYRDRHGERPRADHAWSDTPAVDLALQHRVGELHSALDAGYQPSPVPRQDGRTSYVDGDRVSIGLGSRYGFALFGTPGHAGLHAQLQRVLPEEVQKDPDALIDEVPDDAEGGVPRGPIEGRAGLQTNSPGFPGWSSEGWLVAIGAELGVGF
jgi:long-chain fatty acid transport protein